MSILSPEFKPSEPGVGEYGMQGCQRQRPSDVCRYRDLGSLKICQKIERYARKYWAGWSDLSLGTAAVVTLCRARRNVSSPRLLEMAGKNGNRTSETFSKSSYSFFGLEVRSLIEFC
jgi:hypothetical protein